MNGALWRAAACVSVAVATAVLFSGTWAAVWAAAWCVMAQIWLAAAWSRDRRDEK